MQDHELEALIDKARSAIRAVKCEIAAQRVLIAGRQFSALLHKANFNPGQLRIPAGDPGGGRWTDGGGSGLIRVGARGRTSVRVRIGSRTLEATPGQATRLAVAAGTPGHEMPLRECGRSIQRGARRPVSVERSRAKSRLGKEKPARPKHASGNLRAADTATMAGRRLSLLVQGPARAIRRQLSAWPPTARSQGCRTSATGLLPPEARAR